MIEGITIHAISMRALPWMCSPSDRSPGAARKWIIEYTMMPATIAKIAIEQAGLLFVDVEAHRTQVAPLQRGDQRLGVDETTTTGVDQHRAGLHHREPTGIDEVLGRRRQRAMQADHVGLRQGFVQGQELPAHGLDACAQGRLGIGVHRQHAATEPGEDAGHGGSNLPRTDHDHGLVLEVETHQPIKGQVAFANPLVGAMGLPVQGEHQRQGMLGHRGGRVGRHPKHPEVQPARRIQIDVVETGAAQGDAANATGRKGLEHGGGEVVVDEGAYRIGAGRQRGGANIQPRLQRNRLDTSPPEGVIQRVSLVGTVRIDGDAHGSLPVGGGPHPAV